MDDDAFLPDMALPALDFDFSNLELELSGNSQRSSQSMMSIRHRSNSIVSSHSGSIVGINLPSSSTQQGAFQLDDLFGGSSVQKPFTGTGRGLFDDEEGNLYQDDMLFEFDSDGNMLDIDVNVREARRAASTFPSDQGRLESDSAASGRVRKEHEDAAAGRILPVLDGRGDLNMINFDDDDMQMLPEAEPFPMMAGGISGSDRPNLLLGEEDKVFSEEASSNTAEAPAKRRKPKAKKIIAMDQSTELRNGDLIVWQKEYLKHMATATAGYNQKKEATQAKNNAEAFVFGNGLNGVGQGIGSSKLPSPLAMFSSVSLMAQITEKPISEPKVKGKKGTKRSPSVDIEEARSSSSKRARQDNPIMDFEDEMPLGNGDEIMLHDSSSGVEIGREAPSALADHPSSALFPWNVSASVNSYQRGASSSIQGGRGSVVPGSIGKRLTSASPLIGRGSTAPGEMDHFFSQMEDAMVLYGRSDNGSEVARSKRGESFGRGVSSSQAEFETFGPAAQVDTQTAGNSQWVKEALDRESGNFFEYMRNTISEKAGDELCDDDDDQLGAGEGAGKKFVTFDELFDTKQNSAMVAAQAFYHILSLATKARVWVQQDVDETLEPFGEIRIGIVA